MRIYWPRQKGNFLEVNSQGETSVPGIYAIGDLTGGKLLAHKAYHDGRVAAEAAAGLNSQLDIKLYPRPFYRA